MFAAVIEFILFAALVAGAVYFVIGYMKKDGDFPPKL